MKGVSRFKVFVFFYILFFFNLALCADRESVVHIDELRRAVSRAFPGDTLYIKNGIYKDRRITLNYSGNDRIFILPEAPGGVAFTGNSTVVFENSKNIVFSGIKFYEIQNPSSLIVYSSSGIELNGNSFIKCGRNPFHTIVRIHNGSSGNTISGNVFDGSLAMSVVIILRDGEDLNNSHNRIVKNIFKNIPSVTSVYKGHNNGMEAIQLGQGEHSEVKLYTEISDNYFENIVGDGTEIISSKTSSNMIFGNIFKNNSSGITLRSGDNVKVFDNYLENTSQGIRVFGSGHSISRNYILNSDIAIQVPSTDLAFGAVSGAADYCQQYNVEIKGNYIISSEGRVAISIGDEKRKLEPKLLSIKDNRIYLDRNAKGFLIKNGTDLNKINFRRNISYRALSDGNESERLPFRQRELKYVYLEGDSFSIPSPRKIISSALLEEL